MESSNAPSNIPGNQVTKERKCKRIVPLSKTQKIVLIVNITLIGLCLFIITICFVYARVSIQAIGIPERSESAIAKVFNCDQSELIQQTTHYSDYWLIRNYFIGRKVREADCGDVTYVTHSGDLQVFDELPELVKSWKAPISIMLFAPGTDFDVAMSSIQYARNCIPEGLLISNFVTFHIFLPFGHTPKAVPNSEETALHWPYKCNEPAPYRKFKGNETYAQLQQLDYPLNVARNLARRAANTHFVLMSDFAYRPGGEGKMVQAFLNLQLQEYCPSEFPSKCHQAPEEAEREVFVLPVYQLAEDTTAPTDAAQLKVAVQAGKVKPVPVVVPPFIGHRHVPYYDERFVEPQTKWHNLLQFYAMCLQNYKFKQLPGDFFLTYHPAEQHALESVEHTERMRSLALYHFQQEYLMLFGQQREEECRGCLESGAMCYQVEKK